MCEETLAEYQPRVYAYEGEGSRCQSLDDVSFSEDNLQFLDHLGPKFNKLGGICREAVTDRQIRS